tara:strand:- start:62 stop:433 length:372 start_codon:yes stop_codon:yes gene_type:complete
MMEMIKDLEKVYDLQTCKEISEHGCVSGVCHNHIYYSQTSSYYDRFEDEILGSVIDNMGENYPACLFVENDYDLVGYKNAMVWNAIESFAYYVVNSHEMLKDLYRDSKEWSSLANCLYKELES